MVPPTVRSKGLLSTKGAFTAASMGSAASAPLKGVVVKRLLYTALGLAARASSSDGVLPSPDAPCMQPTQRHTSGRPCGAGAAAGVAAAWIAAAGAALCITAAGVPPCIAAAAPPQGAQRCICAPALTSPRLARLLKLGSSCSVGLQLMPAGIAGLRVRSSEPMPLAEPMSRMAEPTADDMAEAGVTPNCWTSQQQHTAR
jgi:hypothetical protein